VVPGGAGVHGRAAPACFFNPQTSERAPPARQRALCELEWPEDLLRQPGAKRECAADGSVIFNGIRVRMGVHVGQPNCRRNPVTGRMDYFGPVVNRTARVSDAAHGGQVAITEVCARSLVRVRP
jgi:class 3 adenylate cyclase